jgi:hypothetical protein
VVSSLFRRIVPTLKVVAPHVLNAGVNMIEDVTSGKKWKDTAIKRVPKALNCIRIPDNPSRPQRCRLLTAANLLENLTKPNEQTGSGKRKRRRQ